MEELKNAGRLLMAHKESFDALVGKILDNEEDSGDIEFNGDGEVVYTVWVKSDGDLNHLQIRNGKIVTDTTSLNVVEVDELLAAVRDGSYMKGS